MKRKRVREVAWSFDWRERKAVDLLREIERAIEAIPPELRDAAVVDADYSSSEDAGPPELRIVYSRLETREEAARREARAEAQAKAQAKATEFEELSLLQSLLLKYGDRRLPPEPGRPGPGDTVQPIVGYEC